MGLSSKRKAPFTDIVLLLNQALISTVFKDPAAVSMWQKNFKDKIKVPVKLFYTALWKTYCDKELPSEEDEPNFIKLKCVEAVVGPSAKTIDIDRFGLILHWYGPLSPQLRVNIIDKIEALLMEPWFHGEITAVEAENILVAENDKFKRNYLIRNSVHPSAPFTMSRIESGNKKNIEFAHHRISYNRTTGEYCMLFESKECVKEIRGMTLSEFVKNARMNLGLKKPVKCRKFDHIFAHKQTQGEYKMATSDNKKKK